MTNEAWRLNTADEITVELSCGSVVIDHEQRAGSTGLANLTLVGRDVTATLHGLTPADLRMLGVACFKFAYRLEIGEEAAAAEPTEPQESRQDSGTGTDAQQDANGFFGTGWYVLRSDHPPVVYVDTADLHRLRGDHGVVRRVWAAGSGEYGRPSGGMIVSRQVSGMDIVAGPFATKAYAEARAWSPEPEPEDADGRMPDELAAMQADAWGVLLDTDETGRAFHIIGTKEQAERWAYDQLCASGGILEPNETEWREQLWEFIDDELESGEMIEFCLLAKGLDERINAFLAAHLPEQTPAAEEIAAAVYGYSDDACRKIVGVWMDRLELAGMKIVRA